MPINESTALGQVFVGSEDIKLEDFLSSLYILYDIKGPYTGY